MYVVLVLVQDVVDREKEEEGCEREEQRSLTVSQLLLHSTILHSYAIAGLASSSSCPTLTAFFLFLYVVADMSSNV